MSFPSIIQLSNIDQMSCLSVNSFPTISHMSYHIQSRTMVKETTNRVGFFFLQFIGATDLACSPPKEPGVFPQTNSREKKNVGAVCWCIRFIITRIRLFIARLLEMLLPSSSSYTEIPPMKTDKCLIDWLWRFVVPEVIARGKKGI